MNAKQENQFKSLVEFLGKVLGPDYEITLHNLTNKRSTLVAIANGHVSGRRVGAPSTGFVEKMLATRQYETNDYLLSYRGRAINNKMLRSSSFFIKNEAQKPVGMLCINFDDSRYRELSKKLLSLCHPSSFLEQNMVYAATLPLPEIPTSEVFYGDMETAFKETYSSTLDKEDADPDQLTREEKVAIVAKLYEKGFFHVKGSIPYAAEQLHSSVASMYRYLKSAKLTADETENETENETKDAGENSETD